MSVLTYNGIELAYIHTHAVDQEAILSEDQTDYLYTRVSINCQCVFNTNLAPALPSEPPTQTMARVRHNLMTPRGALTFSVGADNLYNLQIIDVKNGPLPRKCTIKQIGGTQTFLVDYTIDFHVIECPVGTSPPAWISNRWRETQSIDEKFYSKWTRTGRIITRSDMLGNADALRGLIIPGIRAGCKRVSSEYTLQEDGLTLVYTFVDQEVWLQPPPPAVKAQGEYVESTADGALRYGEVRVTLDGDKRTDKTLLLRLAILTVVEKLRTAGVSDHIAGTKMFSAAFKEGLYENTIEVRARALIQPNDYRILGISADLRRVCKLPLPSTEVTGPPDPGARGTAGINLIAQSLKDPCATISVQQTGGTGTSTLVGTAPETPLFTAVLTAFIPDDFEGKYVSTLTSGVYTDYRVSKRYESVLSTFQLPLAAACGTCVMVSTGAVMGRLIVDWIASRDGDRPKIPRAVLTSDPNATLLSEQVQPEQIQPTADGVTMRHTIKGRYVYGFKDMAQVTVKAPLPPYVHPSVASEASYLQSDILDGIIDPPGPAESILQSCAG